MEASVELITTDFELCIKCQEPGGILVERPRQDSYGKFLTGVEKFAKCGMIDFVEIHRRLSKYTSQDLLQSNAKWHGACYNYAINGEKLDRAEKAYRRKFPGYAEHIQRSGNEEVEKHAMASKNAAQLELVNTEFFSKLRNMLSDDKYVSINVIRDAYQELVDSHGISKTFTSKQVKRNMLERMSDELEFFRTRMNFPEIVSFSSVNNRAAPAAADFILLGKIVGIDIQEEEAVNHEQYHQLCVTPDHRSHDGSSDFDQNTSINTPKPASMLKAQQTWKEIVNTESNVHYSHIFTDHSYTGDKKCSARDVTDNTASKNGHQQADVDFLDRPMLCSQQLELWEIDPNNLTVDVVDNENDGNCDYTNSKSTTCNRIVNRNALYGCIFHCSPSKYSGRLISPQSMESWHTLMSAANIWKYRDILDIAEKIQTCDDLQIIKYHNKCRRHFAFKSTLEIIKCSELRSNETPSSPSAKDSNYATGECLACQSTIGVGSGTGVNTVLGADNKCKHDDTEWSSSKKIINSDNISKCVIHCVLTAEHDRLHSPLSMEAWNTILRAAGIWKYQRVLDIATKIKTDADLKIVKYHSKCCKYFTMISTLEIRQRQEMNISNTKLLSSAKGYISSDENDECIHCHVTGRQDNEDDFERNLCKENTNCSAISECIIHCSHSADHDPLCSPRSMKLWHILMNAGIILNHRRILDAAEKIETDADLLLVRYHKKCLKIFTMKTILKTKHQESNSTTTLLSSPTDQFVNDEKLLPDQTELTSANFGFAGNLCDMSTDSDNTAEHVSLFAQSSTSYNIPANRRAHPVNLIINKHLEAMATMLLQYRADHFLCDAIVLVDDGELQAHSVILSAGSPVFKAAFTMPTISRCVRVSNVNMNVMKLVLGALYTGRIGCEDIKRIEVKEVLVRLQVDICKLEENDAYEIAANDVHMNSGKEECVRSDDNPRISFNSIEALDNEMENIAEKPPVPEIGSKSLEEIRPRSTHLNDNNDFQLHEMEDNGATDMKRITNTKKDLSYGNYQTVEYQCSALTPEQKKRLQQLYFSLCDIRQCLMLASLVEVYRAHPEVNDCIAQNFTGIDKLFVPLDETGQLIRVCRKTFCQIFSINKYTLYKKIEAGVELKYGTGKAVGFSPVDDNRLNVKQKEKNIIDDMSNEVTSFGDTGASSLTALVSTSCQCPQCMEKYKCAYCGHLSSNRNHRWLHLKWCKKAQSHAAINGYGCSCCSRTFTTRNERKEHVLAQHGKHKEKRVNVCDICSKSFSRRDDLKIHRDAIHKGNGHLCQFCGKTLLSKSHLIAHVATHSRENIIREFKCNLCPMKFKRQLCLIMHKEKVHRIVEPRVSVYCDKCGKRYGAIQTMRCHQRLYCRGRGKTDTVRRRSK